MPQSEHEQKSAARRRQLAAKRQAKFREFQAQIQNRMYLGHVQVINSSTHEEAVEISKRTLGRTNEED